MNHEIDDDHRIENHLRSFRPLPPAPLPRPKSPWKFAVLSAAAVLVISALVLPLRFRTATPATLPEPEPSLITIGRANRLLTDSPSWKEVIEETGFAFPSPTHANTPKNGSVLEFLSQEDLSK